MAREGSFAGHQIQLVRGSLIIIKRVSMLIPRGRER